MANPIDGSFSRRNEIRSAPVVSTAGNATVSGSPAENALDPIRSKKWRVGSWTNKGRTSGTPSRAQIVIDAGKPVEAGCFGLIGCNATKGKVKLIGSNSADLTTDTIAWDLDLYEAKSSDMQVFYPDERRVRFVEPRELSLYSTDTSEVGSNTTPPDNVFLNSELCRYHPGIHTRNAAYLHPDDLEVMSGGKTFYNRLSSPDLYGSTYYEPGVKDIGKATSPFYWRESQGSIYQYYNQTNSAGVKGRVGDLAAVQVGTPAVWTYRQNENLADWPASSNYSDTVGSQFVRTGRINSDLGIASILQSDSGNVRSVSVNSCVQIAFRLTGDEGNQWNLFGWSFSSNNNTGIAYIKDSSTEGGHFKIKASTDDSGVGAVTPDIPCFKSRIDDGAFHVLTMIVTGHTTTGFGAWLWLDGTRLSSSESDGKWVFGGSTDTVTGYWLYTVGAFQQTAGDASLQSSSFDIGALRAGSNGVGYNSLGGESDANALASRTNAEMMRLMGLQSDSLAREYWAVEFDGVHDFGFTGDTLEVGSIWIGDRLDIGAKRGSTSTEVGRSTSSKTVGGEVHQKKKSSLRTQKVDVGNLTQESANDIAKYVADTSDGEVIVDMFASEGSGEVRDSGQVYGFTSGRAKVDLQPKQGSRVSIEVKETL